MKLLVFFSLLLVSLLASSQEFEIAKTVEQCEHEFEIRKIKVLGNIKSMEGTSGVEVDDLVDLAFSTGWTLASNLHLCKAIVRLSPEEIREAVRQLQSE